MIKCKLCQGRVRPPSRPWLEVESGVHFYEAGSSMKEYANELGRMSKRIPFVHKACRDAAAPGTLSQPFMIALDLDAGLRRQQRRGR